MKGSNKAEPTHYCMACGKPLGEDWPYAACQECAKKPCPHGNTQGACNDCDIESDFAYDSHREGTIT